MTTALAPEATNVVNQATAASHSPATIQVTPTRWINVPSTYALLFNPATGQALATDSYFKIGDSVLGIVFVQPNGFEQILHWNGSTWNLIAYSNRSGTTMQYGKVFKDLPSFRNTAVVTRT